MRAKDFLNEFTINVPVTINIPMNDLLAGAQHDVVNPGVRYGDNDSAKWSPPLQQHLDTMKDGVGVTMPDVVEKPEQGDAQVVEQPQVAAISAPAPSSKRQKLMSILAARPSQPG